MSRSRRRWLGAFPVLLGACAGGWQSSDLSGLPTAERYPGAPAVVVRDEQEVVFHSGVDGRPVADESVHRLVRVLRPGAERLDTIVLTYSREFERVTSFRARTVADSGAVRRFDDYVDYPASDNTFFSDERAVRLDVSPVSPGSVIEYRYTMRYQEPRLFHLGHTFGNLYPVVEARLVVRAPRDWTVEHVERLLGEPVALPPREEFDGNDRLLVWEKRDLPPLQLPPASPPLSELAPTVSVRLATWRENGALVSAPSSARELSAWGARFSADAPFPAVKARAEQILAGVAPDPESRARALYGWVRDHVKYCAIEVGYGRWRPHAAEEVDRTRYGD